MELDLHCHGFIGDGAQGKSLTLEIELSGKIKCKMSSISEGIDMIYSGVRLRDHSLPGNISNASTDLGAIVRSDSK